MKISTIVRGDYNQGIRRQPGLVERVEHFADSLVEMFDQRDYFGALRIHVRLAFLHLFQPFRRRLNRVMRRVIGKIEKKRFSRFRLLLKIFARPRGEYISRVSLGIHSLSIRSEEHTSELQSLR